MKTLTIIASGPSLTRSDVERVEGSGLPILGINNAYQLTDKLDYLYACDRAWWHRHYDHVQTCEKYSLEKTDFPDVIKMEDDGYNGLSPDWPKLKTGGNGGHQAINLAFLLGYGRLILTGFDCQAPEGQTHWHGDHPTLNNPGTGNFKMWIEAFNNLAQILKEKGIKVLNATRQTALTCFPLVKLEDVL